MAVAAGAGTLAVARPTARSGSSASRVPNARMPKPNQIQLTSGLTTTCRVTDWSWQVEAGITM